MKWTGRCVRAGAATHVINVQGGPKMAQFLADRTNGRAYATVLRLSVVVVCLWRYVLWLNGAS